MSKKPTLGQVRAVEDGDGHWYIIPNSDLESFCADLEDEDLIDSGGFDEKWSQYVTGGDLNLVQLWAEI